MAITTEQLVDDDTAYILTTQTIDSHIHTHLNGLYNTNTNNSTRKSNLNTIANLNCKQGQSQKSPKLTLNHTYSPYNCNSNNLNGSLYTKKNDVISLANNLNTITTSFNNSTTTTTTTTTANSNLTTNTVVSNGCNNGHFSLQRNAKPMRILIFNESFYPYTSGISRRFIEIITRLARRGFKIHVLTGSKSADGWIKEDILRENVTFGILRAKDFKNHIDCALPFLYPQYGILSEVRKFKPDVVHVVEHTPAALLCITIAKILDIPLVCSSHTHVDSYIPLYIHDFALNLSLSTYRFVRAKFLNMANCNLTVSSDFVYQLANSGIGDKIHVWKTGVDSDLFHPKHRNHETRLKMFNGHYSPDKILLVSIGRISPEKNFEFLLKILERCPETFLCIVGDGPYRKNIESSFPKDRTHFMGFLQGEKLASAYASADFFVYASVSETFGQVYLEAMSCGVPVVAAEGKQMKEFFQNRTHGNIWEPGCVDSAVKALRDTISDQECLAKNCRLNALNHSWDGSADQIIDIYSKYNGYTKNTNPIYTLLRLVYYFIKYLILLLMVGLFMAPFVTRPKSMSSEHNEKRNSTSSSLSKNDRQKAASPNTHPILSNLYILYYKLTESNHVCAFLATLSALFVSLVLYFHQYMV